MTLQLKQLAQMVVELPPKDRAFLAERLLVILEEEETEQAWRREAKRRRDEVR